MGELLRTRSSKLFPKAIDRLTILAGIGRISDPGYFSIGGLANQLKLPQPKVSKELAHLRELGLVVPAPDGATLPLMRTPTTFWAGCVHLHNLWSDLEKDTDK